MRYYCPVTTERWQSGRMRILGKDVYGKLYRGFESRPLRRSEPVQDTFVFTLYNIKP